MVLVLDTSSYCALQLYEVSIALIVVNLQLYFGVRGSLMFHFMFVHNTFSSVWVAGWPHFGK